MEYDIRPDGGDTIELLLHRKFSRRDRVKIGGDRGVLSAVDRRMFVGIELLYHSLTLSHDVRFALVDLGMLPEQRRWCEDQGIEVIDVPEESLVFPDKEALYWQTWNKPVYIQHSPFRETLWIDADCIVRGSLAVPFKLLAERPFMVEDSHAAEGFTAANRVALYRTRKFFVPESRRATIYPNAGVLGFVPERDHKLIETWKRAIAEVFLDGSIRPAISWFDQGALIWALEATNNLDLIRPHEWMFNCPGRPPTNDRWGPEGDDLVAFLRSLPDRDGAVIRHYTSVTKPWDRWEKKTFQVELPDTTSKKLRVLVLSHININFTYHQPRPYLDFVNLSQLPIGQHQTNELAESRIYLDPTFMDRFGGREYVGLASARWNDKYQWGGGMRLQDLHKVKDRLAPDVVWAGWPLRMDRSWVEKTCEHNVGMGRMLDELADFTGMPLENGPSFWSNNFICHRDVMEQYHRHFTKVYAHFAGKYGNRFDFTGMDTKRTPAYFYEAVTVHYFANRPDLKIRRLMDGDRLKV